MFDFLSPEKTHFQENMCFSTNLQSFVFNLLQLSFFSPSSLIPFSNPASIFENGTLTFITQYPITEIKKESKTIGY